MSRLFRSSNLLTNASSQESKSIHWGQRKMNIDGCLIYTYKETIVEKSSASNFQRCTQLQQHLQRRCHLKVQFWNYLFRGKGSYSIFDRTLRPSNIQIDSSVLNFLHLYIINIISLFEILMESRFFCRNIYELYWRSCQDILRGTILSVDFQRISNCNRLGIERWTLRNRLCYYPEYFKIYGPFTVQTPSKNKHSNVRAKYLQN